MKLHILALVATAFVFAPFAEASAASPSAAGIILASAATHLDLGRKTGTPRGYVDLCRQGHAVCRLTLGTIAADSNGLVELTEARRNELSAVNSAVNQRIRPAAEGVDVWTVGGNRGDCEDYAITKKAQLMAQGWPARSLLVALAWTRGQQHAVLVVRTTAGDLVLDNKSGIAGPRGQSWSMSTIYRSWRRGTGILNNELYIGRLVWNRQRFVKDPKLGSGKQGPIRKPDGSRRKFLICKSWPRSSGRGSKPGNKRSARS